MTAMHADDPAWMARAACKGADTNLWFPSDGRAYDRAAVREALTICQHCPVRQDCLDYALAQPETHGIWGGASENERRRLRRGLPTKRAEQFHEPLQGRRSGIKPSVYRNSHDIREIPIPEVGPPVCRHAGCLDLAQHDPADQGRDGLCPRHQAEADAVRATVGITVPSEPIDPRFAGRTHGSRSTYADGCRCTRCRQASAEERRRWPRRRAECPKEAVTRTSEDGGHQPEQKETA